MSELRRAVPDQTITRFLQLCLCGRWDPTALQDASMLAARIGLDWNSLREAACVEGLAPMLYHILRDREVVPLEVEQALRDAYYYTAIRNLFLLDELSRVLCELGSEKVDVIVLKGAGLAEAIYRNIALRPMNDLDLLVQRDDLPSAFRVLSALGYAPCSVDLHDGAAAKYENEVMLHKPGDIETFVEVHWSLFDSPFYQRTLPMDWFWKTALPAQIGGAPAWVLGCEAQVLHLCGHLLLHHSGEDRQQLRWLHDVAEVIALYQTRIDWEQVLDRAQACNLVLPLQQTLARVADEWRVPIPRDVLKRLRALRPSHDERRVFAELTAEHRSVARRFYADLAAMPDWRQWLRFAWSNLLPSRSYIQHRYHVRHPALVPLYYPYRWFLGLRSALRSLPTPR